ncbi:MAG TPA: helix-turn-helix domain-containing protein [Sphingobium sp.]|uniref:TetR/AcrR family transcriptional regulator n=1 Tax=Sphingobium sp. TaxID=1912891 RepID=UPI002ED643DB
MALPFSLDHSLFMIDIINKSIYDDHHDNVNGAWRWKDMKVTREQMAQNRDRILTEAGRLFREKGFDAVSVAEVMKAAGLTHGGFYGHFRSKDDLIAHAISQAVGSQSATDDIDAWIDAYLSGPHRDHPELGCPMAALAGFMRQQAPEARASMAKMLAGQIDALAQTVSGTDATARRRAAIGRLSAMVGALILSRAIDDPALSDELLAETRAWIDDADPPAPKLLARRRRAA